MRTVSHSADAVTAMTNATIRRADERQPRDEVRDIDGDAVATIHVERRDSSRSAPGPPDVAVEEPEGDEPRDDEEQGARAERREEDRGKLDLVVPEPVGREAGEPGHPDEGDERSGENAEHDAAHSRADRGVGAAIETGGRDGHGAVNWQDGAAY